MKEVKTMRNFAVLVVCVRKTGAKISIECVGVDESIIGPLTL
jgi:hypothetical protein